MRLVDLTSLEEVSLPNDLLWVDELSWVPVTSAASYSLTGALLLEAATRQKGRPITLQPPGEDMAWVRRSVATTLHSWAEKAGRKFKLVLEYPTDTREFVVAFRHYDGPLEASPVRGFPDHSPDDWFNITIRLIEVE